MTFRERFNRAWTETEFLRWKEELGSVLIVGTGTYAALRISGSNQGASDELISIGAGILALALLPTVEFVWNLAAARARILEERLDALDKAVKHQGPRPSAQPDPTEGLRVALYAIRTELAACAIRMQEARARGSWWDPERDPLPASKWEEHFATLTHRALPDALHERIEKAYQHCDRLNHHAARYIDEHRRAQLFPLLPIDVLKFQAGDEDRLSDALGRIAAANSAITNHLRGDRTDD